MNNLQLTKCPSCNVELIEHISNYMACDCKRVGYYNGNWLINTGNYLIMTLASFDEAVISSISDGEKRILFSIKNDELTHFDFSTMDQIDFQIELLILMR